MDHHGSKVTFARLVRTQRYTLHIGMSQVGAYHGARASSYIGAEFSLDSTLDWNLIYRHVDGGLPREEALVVLHSADRLAIAASTRASSSFFASMNAINSSTEHIL